MNVARSRKEHKSLLRGTRLLGSLTDATQAAIVRGRGSGHRTRRNARRSQGSSQPRCSAAPSASCTRRARKPNGRRLPRPSPKACRLPGSATSPPTGAPQHAKRFVAQQKARLTALRAAAACSTATGDHDHTPTTTPQAPSLDASCSAAASTRRRRTRSGATSIAPAADELDTHGGRSQQREGIRLDRRRLARAPGVRHPRLPRRRLLHVHHLTLDERVYRTRSAARASLLGVLGRAPDFQQDPPLYIQKILAHEVFHVMQAQLDHLIHESTTPPMSCARPARCG